MKIQNLAIIFLIITVPLIMILSYYLNVQKKTLETQALYDTKLAEATKEGIKAFEVNTVDWADWESKKNSTTKRNNAMAAVNTFMASLANNLNISGTAKDYMENYIPAVVLTMYDAYYIYTPSYLPVSIQNKDGVQLYFSEKTGKISDVYEVDSKIIFEPKTGATTRTASYKYKDEPAQNITFVTDISDAKTEYKHTLNNNISYTAKYSKGSITDAVVNYTLDNRIYVYGKVGGKSVEKDGYLVYFNTTTSKIPRINLTTNSFTVNTKVSDAEYNNTKIDTEVLTEQVAYKENGTFKYETFKYIYDTNHDKFYFDEDIGMFFTVNSKYERNYLSESNEIKIGSDGCKYKSVSVLTSNNEYKKIYQVLNGRDRYTWCMSLAPSNNDVKNQKEVIDTKLSSEQVEKLGLSMNEIYDDFSAISYYVEAYAFTNWTKDNLGGKLTYSRTEYNTETKKYEYKTNEVNGIFDISVDNDPEKENSLIVDHKKSVMKEHVISNLSISIANYGRQTYDFKLPILSETEWEQVFSNISLITFFQGVPIGQKYYNNYAIATSTTNREFVDPGELYFSGQDINYHRVYCQKCGNIVYTGYRSVEYVKREVKENNGISYYYKHDEPQDTNSEIACYYCLVNRGSYIETTDNDVIEKQTKSYSEAIARERYYQKESLIASLNNRITTEVRKIGTSVENTDVIFILDDSSSMVYQNVKNACYLMLDYILGGITANQFYIGFIRFSGSFTGQPASFQIANEIGHITRKFELNEMKNKINLGYGKYGNTDFVAGLEQAKIMAQNGTSNPKTIIFMTDGEDNAIENSATAQTRKNRILSELDNLKNNYNVKAFYGIQYEHNGSVRSQFLQTMVNHFGNGDYLYAYDNTLAERFEGAFSSIKSYEIVQEVNGGYSVADMEVSDTKPITIYVTQRSVEQKITITQMPTANSDILSIRDGIMYIDRDAIYSRLNLDNGIDISICVEYYVR